MPLDTSSALLLRLRDAADGPAWGRLVALYAPLLTAWALRAGVPAHDADDLVQEVLLALAREMPGFRYDRSRGSFRGWLRVVLANRLRHRRRCRAAMPAAEPAGGIDLDSFEDPHGDLARRWDADHDRHVAACLLEAVRPRFGAQVWAAFAAVVMGGERPAGVAEALGLSVDAVYQARSRVLAELRREAAGLLD